MLAHAAFKRRRRDVTGARALAREARRALAACADAGALADAARGRSSARCSWSRSARGGGADAELSEREVAVLRLLATDLSQREIGSQLFVSFNTVKSHTRTLFRKLGVTSRADAVARGRELGHL